MKSEEKKKKKNIKMIGVLMLGIVLLIGLSYAWFHFQIEGKKEINMVGGREALDIRLVEQEGNLNLTNAVPVPDRVGQKGEAFTFYLQNNSRTYVNYTLKLVDNEE